MTTADKEVLSTFPSYFNQNDAMKEWVKDKKILRVFSYENPRGTSPGSRKYLTTELSKFIKWYLKLRKEIRNFYEIIPIDTPCRLYFDLEYCKEYNENANSDELLKLFCELVKDMLKSEYSIDLEIEKTFLILESSNEKKYSTHIIVHLPNRFLFSSNVEMKKFVDYVYLTMLEKDISLIYNGKEDANGEKIRVPIIDGGVYTKNRNFRLYLSCKLGKISYLKLADYCNFYKCKGVNNPNDFIIFLDSLCVPRFYETYNVLPEYNVNEEVLKTIIPKAKKQGRTLGNLCKVNNDYCEYIKTGHGFTSPFPLVEAFILQENKKYVNNTGIRMWEIIKLKATDEIKINFHIEGSRYCFNVKREHKSNHVFWQAYFDPYLICKQKCFDRECAGKPTVSYALPQKANDEAVQVLSDMNLYQPKYNSFLDSFYNLESDQYYIQRNLSLSRKRNFDEIENDIHDTPVNKMPMLMEEAQVIDERIEYNIFKGAEALGEEVEENGVENVGIIDEEIRNSVIIDKGDNSDVISTEKKPNGIIDDEENFSVATEKENNDVENEETSVSEKLIPNPSPEDSSLEFIVVDGKFQEEKYDSFAFSPTQMVINDDAKNYLTDDDSDDNLVNLSEISITTLNPLDVGFINSTLLTDDSLLTNDTRVGHNVFILNENYEVDGVLETSYESSENMKTSSFVIPSNSIVREEQQTNTSSIVYLNARNELPIQHTPSRREQQSRNEDSVQSTPPRKEQPLNVSPVRYSNLKNTENEMNLINKKCHSSFKCHSPFKSPVVTKTRRLINRNKIEKKTLFAVSGSSPVQVYP